MEKKTNPRKDFTQVAHGVFQKAVGEAPAKPEKNKAAVELGRLGGKARAKNLSDQERKDSAAKAIEKRWVNSPEKPVSTAKQPFSKLLKRRGVIRSPSE